MNNSEGKVLSKYNFTEYIPYIIIVVVCLSKIISCFGIGDEIWNYNFAKNIVEGKLPYRDISMIQTPLSAYVSASFMFFLGKGLISFRVVAYVLMVVLFGILYRLCRKISNDITVASLVTFVCFILNYTCFIYNYNYLSALIILIIMHIEISNKDLQQGYKMNIVLGLLYGMLPLIKQNTGGVIFLLHLCICILDYSIYQRNDRKLVISKVLTSILPGVLWGMYLVFTGTIYDFIEYGIIGINSFVHRDSYWKYYSRGGIDVVFAILPVCMMVYALYRMILRKEYSRYKIVTFIISTAWFWLVIFPLADYTHLFVGYIPLFPMLLCHIKYKSWNSILKIISNTAVLTITFFFVYACLPIGGEYKVSDMNNYKCVFIEKEAEKRIRVVDDYIKEKQKEDVSVYIADVSAAAFTVPVDLYRKNWDMLLIGNIGETTVEQLLDVEENAVFLINDDIYEQGMQAHYELIGYIKENYECVDKVANFEVYTMPK